MNVREAVALIDYWISETRLESLGWTSSINRRKKALGICNYTKKEISLSKHWLHLPYEEIRDTVLHEIAHALAGTHDGHFGHGRAWKRWCVEIGAKPERLADVAEHRIPEPKWAVMIKGTDEFVRTCNRRLKNLETRFIRGRREETLGKLYHYPFKALPKSERERILNGNVA
jgi:predicted SprT family Zn-dependent metalloprotease